MDKFPVTSKNGNTYMVEILRDRYAKNIFYIVLLKERLNWRKKVKFKPVYGDNLWDRTYDGKKHNFDFVKMAQMQVKFYEDILEAEKQRELALENGHKAFKEWDGVCK